MATKDVKWHDWWTLSCCSTTQQIMKQVKLNVTSFIYLFIFFTLAIDHIPKYESSTQSFSRALNADSNEAIQVPIHVRISHGHC